MLVHKYQGLVLSLVRRYLGSRSPGVEDVAQQVFVRVFRSKMTYQPKAKDGAAKRTDFMTVEEAAEVVAWLAGDASGVLSGSQVVLDRAVMKY